MEPMRELIEEATVERAMLLLLGGGIPAGLLLGGLWGWRRHRLREGLGKGFFLGLLGPLTWGMWRLYSYLTRYDPRTDYFGLERVDVFFLNLLLFTAVGAGLGWLWACLFPPAPKENLSVEEREDGEGVS